MDTNKSHASNIIYSAVQYLAVHGVLTNYTVCMYTFTYCTVGSASLFIEFVDTWKIDAEIIRRLVSYVF